jgi:3'(2'), 5'-bisphosphate nucleotidase
MSSLDSTRLDHTGLVTALLPALLEAGRIEMKYFTSCIEVEQKADRSPVTAADREAEAVLLAALSRIAPGIPVVAEEASAAGVVPETDDVFFLVDPLDGTREFIEKRPEFTVNIGLVRNRHPLFGIVYAPASGRLFATLAENNAAEASLPADASPSALDSLAWSAIRARQPDPDALVALESLSHRTPETADMLARYKVRESRRAGSSLKFCLIARGEADLYPRLGPTCEWDTAAGHAVLGAAGGSVVTVDGAPLIYGKAPKYLNPHFIAWGARAL